MKKIFATLTVLAMFSFGSVAVMAQDAAEAAPVAEEVTVDSAAVEAPVVAKTTKSYFSTQAGRRYRQLVAILGNGPTGNFISFFRQRFHQLVIRERSRFVFLIHTIAKNLFDFLGGNFLTIFIFHTFRKERF